MNLCQRRICGRVLQHLLQRKTAEVKLVGVVASGLEPLDEKPGLLQNVFFLGAQDVNSDKMAMY